MSPMQTENAATNEFDALVDLLLGLECDVCWSRGERKFLEKTFLFSLYFSGKTSTRVFVEASFNFTSL